MEIKRGAGYVNGVAQEGETIYKGIKVGVVEGYIATWDKDRGNDVFQKGAFAESIKEWQRQGRDIKTKDMHGESIGVYPLEFLKEDDIGLFGKAYINLEIQSGQEAMSKARMGIYDRKSIGFSADPNHTEGEFPYGREIGKAHIWEGSLVDEPMNLGAHITSIKAHCDDVDVRLGLVDESTGIMVLTEKALFKAYSKLINNQLKLSKAEWTDAKNRIEAHYARCELTPPKETEMLGQLLGNADDIQKMSLREIETVLRDSGCSEKQSKALIANLKSEPPTKKEEGDTLAQVATMLTDMLGMI